MGVPLRPPEEDLARRQPVWEQLQMFFMDTDPAFELEVAARVCAQSPYEVEEIEEIFFQEVLPACRFNMFALPAPEWQGFDLEWLTQRILKKHRFGKRRPWLLRREARYWWQKLRSLIDEIRSNEGSSSGGS